MPNGKEIVFPWVNRHVALLGEETSNKLLKMLNELPTSLKMIHLNKYPIMNFCKWLKLAK